MPGRGGQNLPYVRAFGVCRPYGIPALGQRDVSVGTQINDHLGLAGKTMHMARWMIVGIDDKKNAIEAARAHKGIITQARLGYNPLSRGC